VSGSAGVLVGKGEILVFFTEITQYIYLNLILTVFEFNIKASQIFYHALLLLTWFRFWETNFTTIMSHTSTCSYALPCALDSLLQPVLLDSTTSSCCCTFSSNFCVGMEEQLCSNPWRDNFVEGKIWDYPSKIIQEWSELGGGGILW